MTRRQGPAARLIPRLVVGITFNTLRIVLTSLGTVRFAFTVAGLSTVRTFLVKTRAAWRQAREPGAS